MTDTSILDDVKHMIGPDEEYDYFDKDLIIHINSVFGILFQLGVGADRSTPFQISSSSDTWGMFTGDDVRRNMVKQYLYLKTRLAFDPPQTSFVLESIKTQIEELEWRLRMMEETLVFGGKSPEFDYDNYKLDPNTNRWVDGDEE